MRTVRIKVGALLVTILALLTVAGVFLPGEASAHGACQRRYAGYETVCAYDLNLYDWSGRYLGQRIHHGTQFYVWSANSYWACGWVPGLGWKQACVHNGWFH